MSADLSRRELLATLLGVPLALLPGCASSKTITAAANDVGHLQGSIVGQSHLLGHLFRDGFRPEPTAWRDAKVIIVGSGIAGLSAAWRLTRAGFTDFLVLELEDEPGGTSSGGNSALCGYPWAAHYIPVPHKENVALVTLLDEMGLLEGTNMLGEPIVAEQFLCRDPQERIYYKGTWYEGLYLHPGASQEDLRQFEAFNVEMQRWAQWRDGKKRRAFALPVVRCSDDSEVTCLDKLSMAEYLQQKGWDSSRLRWYVEYACRDDYGATLEDTSAWAGIFYFVSRVPAAGGDAEPLLTWPEGNARLMRHLLNSAKTRLKTGVAVADIAPISGEGEHKVALSAIDKASHSALGFRAQRVIFAAPQFVAGRVLRQYREAPPRHLQDFDYSAWAVANLFLKERPVSRGFPLCWDNVLYESQSLGYVTATHQLGLERGPTIFTWYYAFCSPAAQQARHQLLNSDWQTLAELALTDLQMPHPNMGSQVERIDVMRWGHAMIKPRPGFMWGPSRRAAAVPLRHIHFAHTDLSGVALFEEAFYHGLRAAEAVLEQLQVPLQERFT